MEGLQVGISRRERAIEREHLRLFFDVSLKINNMTDEEYSDLLSEFNEEQQEKIRIMFKPTKKELNNWSKELHFGFRF